MELTWFPFQLHEVKEWSVLFVWLSAAIGTMALLGLIFPVMVGLWVIASIALIGHSVYRDLEQVYSFDAEYPSFGIHTVSSNERKLLFTYAIRIMILLPFQARLIVNVLMAVIAGELIKLSCNNPEDIGIMDGYESFYSKDSCNCSSFYCSLYMMFLCEAFVVSIIRSNVTALQAFISFGMVVYDALTHAND